MAKKDSGKMSDGQQKDDEADQDNAFSIEQTLLNVVKHTKINVQTPLLRIGQFELSKDDIGQYFAVLAKSILSDHFLSLIHYFNFVWLFLVFCLVFAIICCTFSQESDNIYLYNHENKDNNV